VQIGPACGASVKDLELILPPGHGSYSQRCPICVRSDTFGHTLPACLLHPVQQPSPARLSYRVALRRPIRICTRHGGLGPHKQRPCPLLQAGEYRQLNGGTILLPTAQATRAAVLLTPAFSMRCARCCSTVRVLILSCLAICLLLRPWQTICRTCRSRNVNSSTLEAAG